MTDYEAARRLIMRRDPILGAAVKRIGPCGMAARQRNELDALPDEEVIERLTAVKGFGRWTAEMFLMFRLHRPDVLPAGDLGIVTAIQRLYKLRKRPDAKRIMKIGEAWRPYRSVASWYLWQTLHEAQEAKRQAKSVTRQKQTGKRKARPARKTPRP